MDRAATDMFDDTLDLKAINTYFSKELFFRAPFFIFYFQWRIVLRWSLDVNDGLRHLRLQ